MEKRKQMEEKLRESEEKYKELTESISDVFFAMDKDLRYTYWNKASEKLTGILAKDAIGKSLTEVFPDVKETRVEQFYLDTLRTQQSQSFVNKYRLGDKDFVFEISAYPTKDGLSVFVKDITERKRAEEELIRLSSAVKMSNDSIVISDLDGKIIDVNEATLKMYGTDDKEDLIGKNSFDLIAPEEREKALAGMEDVLEKGYHEGREYHIITKDGGRIPVEMSVAIMKDVDGKPIGFVGISRDIKERKMMEEKLRESEERFRNLYESIKDPVVVYVGGGGHIIQYNKAFKEQTGYTDEELKNKTFLDFVHPGDRAMILEKYRTRYPEEEFPLVYEIRALNKKGEVIPLEISVSPYRVKGKVVGVEAIGRDITERKQMEEKLRQYSEHLEELVQKRTEELLESEKRYSVLVEEASDGVVMIQDGKTIFANKKALEIVGYSRDELINLPPEKLIDQKYLKSIKEGHDKTIRGEIVPSPSEAELITKTGERVPVEGSPSLVHYQGRPAVIIIWRDIRERKRMEEERLKLEKLATIGELATMVGHDLRNPLQSIENATYYLNNELPHLPIPQKALEMLQIINDSVNYADKIIRDLHDFSATKKPILQKNNINTIVKETLSQVKAPENVELKTELGHLPEIKADKNMIKRIFLNLAVNGIEAMEKGGTLKVSTKKTGGFVEVSFKDTGTGIPNENMKKIFTPFFTTRAKGMGMGLPICKKFVEIHGGSIEVESEKGKGTIFTVKLPIQQKIEVKNLDKG